MRLVLVNLMDDLHRRYSSALISQPPLALGALYTLTPKDIEISVLDEQVDNLEWDGDVFAFSVTTQLAKKTYHHADLLRKQGKKVILGGYHVTACPDEAAKHADCVITGEAEMLWPQICDDIKAGRLKPRYKGYPTPGVAMPAIDRNAFKGKNYVFNGSLYASRGCVYQCTFCGSSRLLGGYRTKPIVTVEKEIDAIRAAHGDVVLQFADDNPLADAAWAREFLALMRKKKARFVCQITVDQICDKELVDELAASGCLAVATGVESLEDDNIKSVSKAQNKGMPLADAVRYCRSKGIHVAALLIVGLDNDTPERIERAVPHLRSIPFSVYDICILRPFPGTGLYASMVGDGRTTPDWWLLPESCPSNDRLPGYLRVYFKHNNFSAQEMQLSALKFIEELNRTTPKQYKELLQTGMKSKAVGFSLKMIAGRLWLGRQAKLWQKDIVLEVPLTT